MRDQESKPKKRTGFGKIFVESAEPVAGAIEGAASAAERAGKHAQSKAEAKEAKRRTLAGLMGSAMKRNRNLFRKGQEYGQELNDYQSQALQDIARGFAQSLHGSTRRG
jgi:hypothetical protein